MMSPRAEHSPSVLERWLGALDLETFRKHYLGKLPYAQPGRAAREIASCDWSVLDRLLVAKPSDHLVVARGELALSPPPRNLTELRTLFRRGIGVAIRNPEPLCPELHALCLAFARDIPGEQRLIVFATPEAAHGFAWHYDAEDVFIIQTEGDKEYFFRRNTIHPNPTRAAKLDFSTFHRETSPLMNCRLLAGDFLYLPRGYWHMAHAHADALSISIGVFPDERTP